MKRRIQAENQRTEAPTSGFTIDSHDDDNYDPVLLPVENEPACRLVNYSGGEEEVSILSTNENVFEGVSCAPKEMVVPSVGEFWEVRNGSPSMYVTIMEDNPDGQCSICYCEECRNGHYRLNDKKFEACLEDFVHKVEEPTTIPGWRETSLLLLSTIGKHLTKQNIALFFINKGNL